MHLFAGGGGGLLGDLILGHNPICAVEWEPYACRILRERAADGWFPDLSVYEGDVRLFNPSKYAGRVGCIHAGFPCQDISVAGKQAGVGEETRSGLYREVLRIADVVRPRELFMENVSAILSNGLGTVLADLSTRRYSARWVCLRASDVGANHHRDRWWLLARKIVDNTSCERWNERRNNNGSDDRNIVTSTSEHSIKVADTDSQDGCASGLEQNCRADRRNESSGRGSVFSNANAQGLQGQFGESRARASSSQSQPGLQDRDGNRRNSWPAESSLGGMDDGMAFGVDTGWWEQEPNVGRVTAMNNNRAAQLKALGNGQVPLQAAVAYSILSELFS